VANPSVTSLDDEEVPRGLRIAAAWAWRLIVLSAATIGALWLMVRVSHVVIPLAIALLLSALLAPPVRFLRRRLRFPPSLAAGLVLVGGLAVVVGTLTLVVNQFIDAAPDLADSASEGITEVQNWLTNGPLNLSTQQLADTAKTMQDWLKDNQSRLTSQAVSTATATIEYIALFFLVLFATFFFLRDGRRIWRWIVKIFPKAAEQPVAEAGEAAWLTLVAYVRATVLVAFIDAFFIGIALWVFKVPLAFPLAALVFLAAFIPIVGATLSGAVAVLVALVDRGWVVALFILGAVILIQQLEGHVLQPMIMGRAVAIHPLAVIVAIAAGVILAGIIGALVAVPIVAVLNTAIRHLAERRRSPAEPPPDAVVVSADPTPST